ncbi:unnamed protein product [Candida verbasci]|uniref:NADH-ubiquinone oxidoreductase n=1 Tax=Candida verbasci TaxID=1227364 RepID=A0A9W4X816_9ASCO|nr:unnamed protein product [Candida verbasci]
MLNSDIFVGGKQWENTEENKLPNNIPEVDEVGATSAPLLSASYYIGDKCKPFNDDFMQCKNENNGGELNCLKEGRRVTRCAISVLKDINKYCFDEFKLHYDCLEQNNQYFNRCRSSEHLLSKCVLTNLNLKKVVPGVKDQIQDKQYPIYKTDSNDIKQVQQFLKSKETNSN